LFLLFDHFLYSFFLKLFLILVKTFWIIIHAYFASLLGLFSSDSNRTTLLDALFIFPATESIESILLACLVQWQKAMVRASVNHASEGAFLLLVLPLYQSLLDSEYWHPQINGLL